MTSQDENFLITFFDLLLKIMTLLSKITSKNWFQYNVSLGWKSANSLISVLNTPRVALSRNIGPKTWHLFGLLIPISTTVLRQVTSKILSSQATCLYILILEDLKYYREIFNPIQIGQPREAQCPFKHSQEFEICDIFLLNMSHMAIFRFLTTVRALNDHPLEQNTLS